MKNIKKINMFFLMVISLLLPNFLYANNCEIKNSYPEEIKKLNESTRKIIKNINSYVIDKGIKSYFQKESNVGLKGLNLITNWGDYSSSFDFYLIEPIWNNQPKEINRDNKLLKKELEGLNKILHRYDKKGYSNIIIPKDIACKGINFCNLKTDLKAGILISQLIKTIRNSNELLQRGSTNQKLKTSLCKNNILLENTNCNKIYHTYKNARTECQITQGGSLEQTWKKIKDVGTNFKSAETGTQEWIDAWNLLVGNTSEDEYRKIEKDTLMKELARQGVGKSQSKQILQNLEDYNHNGGYSFKNNPISNIYKTIKNSVKSEDIEELKNYKKSINDLFEENNTNKVSIKDIKNITKNYQSDKKIKNEIDKIYKEQLPLSAKDELNSNQIISELININNTVLNSNNIIIDTIKISQKVCNSQGQGDGKCEY